MTDDPAELVERELSLTNLAVLAARRWKALVAVGVAAGLLAGLVLMITPENFEATSTILVKRTSSGELTVGLDRTAIEPDYFAAILGSDEVLSRILEKFQLDQPPYRFNLERFRDAVDISPLRNENSIRIRVKLPALEKDTPKKVADVANGFTAEAESIAQGLLEEDIQRSMRLIDAEYQKAEKYLADIRKEYQKVKWTAPLEEKTKEIENIQLYQRELQHRLAGFVADLKQKRPKLAVLEEMLSGEPRLLTATRALEEEPAFMEVLSARTGKAATGLYSATSITQLVNDVYTNLRNLYDTTKADVVGMEQAVKTLEADIADCNERIRKAERVLNASSEAVDFWKDRLETAILTHRAVDERHARVAMTIIADRQDMISLSKAVPPIKPSGVPRIVLVSVTPIVAMMIFLGILFVVEVIRISIKV